MGKKKEETIKKVSPEKFREFVELSLSRTRKKSKEKK